MTDEVKPVEETTENKPVNSTSEEDASKQTTEVKSEEGIDYEALYLAEMEARENAEKAIIRLRKKKGLDETEEEPTEDLKSYVDQKIQEVKSLTLEERYSAEIEKASKNESEKKLIKLLIETNNFSGNISEQVQKAKAIANYRKVAEANKELVKATNVKAGGEDSSSYRSEPPKAVNLTADEITLLKRHGVYEKYLKEHT